MSIVPGPKQKVKLPGLTLLPSEDSITWKQLEIFVNLQNPKTTSHQHPMTAIKIPEALADIYYGGPHKVADSFILGQGFEVMLFDGEQKIINREWAERCRSFISKHPAQPKQSTVKQAKIYSRVSIGGPIAL